MKGCCFVLVVLLALASETTARCETLGATLSSYEQSIQKNIDASLWRLSGLARGMLIHEGQAKEYVDRLLAADKPCSDGSSTEACGTLKFWDYTRYGVYVWFLDDKAGVPRVIQVHFAPFALLKP